MYFTDKSIQNYKKAFCWRTKKIAEEILKLAKLPFTLTNQDVKEFKGFMGPGVISTRGHSLSGNQLNGYKWIITYIEEDEENEENDSHYELNSDGRLKTHFADSAGAESLWFKNQITSKNMLLNVLKSRKGWIDNQPF